MVDTVPHEYMSNLLATGEWPFRIHRVLSACPLIYSLGLSYVPQCIVLLVCTQASFNVSPHPGTLPLCTCTALSKHGVGVEQPFLGNFGTAVFVVQNVGLGVCRVLL
jgi:hypothetical protein